MYVYVVTQEERGESSRILGIYSSLKSAKTAANKEIDRYVNDFDFRKDFKLNTIKFSQMHFVSTQSWNKYNALVWYFNLSSIDSIYIEKRKVLD